MEFQRRKRLIRLFPALFSPKSFIAFIFFFAFLLLASHDSSFPSHAAFHPVLKLPSLSIFPSRLVVESSFESPHITVEARVLFPDHLMVILSRHFHSHQHLLCVYRFNRTVLVKPPLSAVGSTVRCPLPKLNYSSEITVGGNTLPCRGRIVSWNHVAYTSVLDADSVLVFVKGFNLRPHIISDHRRFRCYFGERLNVSTRAIAAAQEVIRCALPQGIEPHEAIGMRVGVNKLPTVARVAHVEGSEKHGLCGCTMVRNQATFLKEWIAYHRWLGVERWFVYDNNSDDALDAVIDALNEEGSNITRHAWPWIKAQEGSFSHCALRAKGSCRWVGFFDIDEFFFFPSRRGQALPGKGSLTRLVENYTDSPIIGELRTVCYSYGPSGLREASPAGVMAGYTCRVQAPERHKSIVRPDRIDATLLNAVHHFKLREGYRYVNVPERKAVVNHYKYQVWDTFKSKFEMRASTYVSDWLEEENQGSRDRVPGLGTEAVEPIDWRFRFCEVWDTGLRDFVYANFADAASGELPWGNSRVE